MEFAAYPLLKLVHVTSVAASYGLFLLRGVWMIRDSAQLQLRWVRITPHVIDTVLLSSALGLAIVLRQYPFVHDWLTAKIIALAIYIALGSIALKHGRTRAQRITAWLLAQGVFFYIASVALTHSPLGLIR